MELKSPPSIEDIDGKKTFIKRKKEEEKLIRKMKSELVDFAAIQKANRERFLRLGEAGLKTDYRSVFTTPEKKTFLTDTESERTTLTVGEFVGVKLVLQTSTKYCVNKKMQGIPPFETHQKSPKPQFKLQTCP